MSAISIVEQTLGGRRDSHTAFSQYKPLLLNLAKGKSVLEIGAGRSPVFSAAELLDNQIDYVANDVSMVELEAMPDSLPSYAFDASKSIPAELENRFDLIFSKMVQEHVSDVETFYRNIARMLKPGGAVLNFHPVLFAFPFVVNLMIPESWSQPLLYALRKDRTRDRSPKFPAHYDQCRVSDGVRSRLQRQGFSELHQIPFYGHGYYKRLPGVREIHSRFTRYATEKDITAVASFSYTIGIK